MREPAEPYVSRWWVAGAIMDGRHKAGRGGGNSVFRPYALYQQQQPSEASAKPACRSHLRFAEHTPALFAKPLGPGYLLTRCLPNKSPRAFVWIWERGGDNSWRICLGAAALFCDPGRDMTLMFDEACCWWIGCSCRAARPPPVARVCCLLRCEPPCSVICGMTGICFSPRPRVNNNSVFAEGQH